MEAEYNYLYEDKYYENAVKNLKSTFYDVVEREEIMLNNLENRIQSQTDENVKARLLDLWSKQNQSLDESIIIFRQLKQSVQVIDSFVKELTEIDDQIVNDILNSANVVVNNSRVDEMRQEDLQQEQGVENTNVVEQPNEEVVQQNEEVVEEPTLTEENVDLGEITTEGSEFDINPNSSDDSFEPVEEEQDVPEIVEGTTEEVTEEVPEMEVVNEEVDGTDLPNVVDAENIDPNAIEEGNEENTNESEELPFANPEENQENKEENPEIVEDIPVDENISENLLNGENTEETSTEEVVEESSEKVENAKLLRFAKGDDVPPKAIIVNSTQYDKLVASLEKQENKFFDRGYFTNELVNNSNYSIDKMKPVVSSDEVQVEVPSEETANATEPVINTENVVSENTTPPVIQPDEDIPSTSLDQVAENVVNNETSPADMEKMLEKANELYKAGKTEEAQALYDEISNINKSLQEQSNNALVMSA